MFFLPPIPACDAPPCSAVLLKCPWARYSTPKLLDLNCLSSPNSSWCVGWLTPPPVYECTNYCKSGKCPENVDVFMDIWALIWASPGTVPWMQHNVLCLHTPISTKWMWRQTNRDQGGGGGGGMHTCHVRLLRNPYTPGVHLEKREMLGVGEVKDVPGNECDPAEECLSVVYGGESTAWRKPTLCFFPPVSWHFFFFFLWSSWFNLDVTSFSSSCVVCFRTCPRAAWRVRSLVFGSTLLFLFHSVCSLSPECCVEEEEEAQLWSHKKHNRDCHLYFPTCPLKCQRSEKHVTPIKKTKKQKHLSSVPFFVCFPSLCFQRPVTNSAYRFNNHTAMRYRENKQGTWIYHPQPASSCSSWLNRLLLSHVNWGLFGSPCSQNTVAPATSSFSPPPPCAHMALTDRQMIV